MNNSNKSPRWRTLLEAVIADPSERRRIARTLGINPISLTRWATGISNPRPKHLYALLTALPNRRDELVGLIVDEFPEFSADMAIMEKVPMEIPVTFYAKVLDAYNRLPMSVRAATIRTIVLQQMLSHLDAKQLGMVIFATQCVPPKYPVQKVRSLRIIDGRGNPPWQHIENNVRYFGLESQIGTAVQFTRPIITNRQEDKKRLYPLHCWNYEESYIAYPLMRADLVVGCLTIISTQKNYFSGSYIELISNYIDLFLLAFETIDFYSIDQIMLGIMPASESQATILEQFNQQVNQLIIEATRKQQLLTRLEAELQLSQQLEQALLDQSLNYI